MMCIPHPCHMYTKCVSTLIHESTPTLLGLCNRWGVNFSKIGVWACWSDVVTSWLMLQTPIECIPHPYQMYAECYCTLLICGWASEPIIIDRGGNDKITKNILSPFWLFHVGSLEVCVGPRIGGTTKPNMELPDLE